MDKSRLQREKDLARRKARVVTPTYTPAHNPPSPNRTMFEPTPSDEVVPRRFARAASSVRMAASAFLRSPSRVPLRPKTDKRKRPQLDPEVRKKKILELKSRHPALEEGMSFNEKGCYYRSDNPLYKQALKRFCDKDLDGSHVVSDEEYDRYIQMVEEFGDIKLNGLDVSFNSDRNLGVESLKNPLFRLFFTRHGNTATIWEREKEELDLFDRFEDLTKEIRDAKDEEEIAEILARRSGVSEQTRIEELLSGAVAKKYSVVGDASKLPFTLYQWVILAELSLIKKQVEVLNPYKGKQVHDKKVFTPKSHYPNTTKEQAVFPGLKRITKAGHKEKTSTFDNVTADYRFYAVEAIASGVSSRCIKQLAKLRETGMLNIAEAEPAMRPFVSEVGVEIAEGTLSGSQLRLAEQVDHMAAQIKAAITRKAGFERYPKVSCRLRTGGGKTAFLENIIIRKYGTFFTNILTVNLNSDLALQDQVFNPDSRFDPGTLVVLDEEAFFSQAFRRRFFPDKNENFGFPVAGKDEDTLAQELEIIETKAIEIKRKIREKASLITFGATDRVEVMRHGEYVRLSHDLLLAERKNKDIRTEVIQLKDKLVEVCTADAIVQELRAFASKAGKREHSTVAETGKGGSVADHRLIRENSPIIKAMVFELSRCRVLTDDVQVEGWVGVGKSRMDEINDVRRLEEGVLNPVKLLKKVVNVDTADAVELQEKVDAILAIERQLYGRGGFFAEARFKEYKDELYISGFTKDSSAPIKNLAEEVNSKISRLQGIIVGLQVKRDSVLSREVESGLVGRDTVEAVREIGTALQEYESNRANLETQLRLLIGSSDLAAFLRDKATVKKINSALKSVGVKKIKDLAPLDSDQIVASSMMDELQLEVESLRERRRARKDEYKELQKRVDDARDEVSGSTFLAEPSKYKTESLAALVFGHIPKFGEEASAIDQHLQYLAMDFDITEETCSETDLQSIQTQSNADVIIVPAIINREGRDVAGCRVYCKVGGSFVVSKPMTIDEFSGNEFTGFKPADSFWQKQVMSQFTGGLKPRIISFFGGPSRRADGKKDGRYGGNFIGGDYNIGLVTKQIAEIDNPNEYRLSHFRQAFSRSRNPDDAAPIERRIIAHREVKKEEFVQTLSDNEEAFERAAALAHLKVKYESVPNGDEEEKTEKKERNRRMLQDFENDTTELLDEINKELRELHKEVVQEDAEHEEELAAANDFRRESSAFMLEASEDNPDNVLPTLDEGEGLEEGEGEESIYSDEEEVDIVDVVTNLATTRPKTARTVADVLETTTRLGDTPRTPGTPGDSRGGEDSKGDEEEFIGSLEVRGSEIEGILSSEVDRNRDLVMKSGLEFRERELISKEDKEQGFCAVITSNELKFKVEVGNTNALIGEFYVDDTDGDDYKPVDFSRAKFFGFTLRDSQDAAPIFGEGVKINGLSFYGTRFEGVDFTAIDFDGCGWMFYGCEFFNCTLPKVLNKAQFVDRPVKTADGTSRQKCTFYEAFPVIHEARDVGDIEDPELEYIDITSKIEKRFSEIKTSGKPSPAMMKLAGGDRGLRKLQEATSRYSGRGYTAPTSSEA